MKNEAFFYWKFVYLLLFAFIAVNTYFYISGDDLVYVWDYKGYWVTWQEYGGLITNNFFHWLQANEHNIRSNDYNPLPVSLLFPFYLILGAGRFSYILGLVLVYLSAVCIIISLFFKRLYSNNFQITLLALILSVMYVPFWRPSLRGYPDIAGLIPMLGAILLVMRGSFSLRLSVKKSLFLGLMLWAPFLLRLWYAYSILTLYFTLPFLVYFYDAVTSSELLPSRLKRLKNIFLTFCFASLTTAVAAYAFQSALIRRILKTDYGTIYSAYQASFSYSIESTLSDVGYGFLPFAAIGILFSIRSPAKKTSLICWFSLVNLLICFWLFTRTQAPGIQHQLPLHYGYLLSP